MARFTPFSPKRWRCVPRGVTQTRGGSGEGTRCGQRPSVEPCAQGPRPQQAKRMYNENSVIDERSIPPTGRSDSAWIRPAPAGYGLARRQTAHSPLHHPRPGIYNAVLRFDRFGTASVYKIPRSDRSSSQTLSQQFTLGYVRKSHIYTERETFSPSKLKVRNTRTDGKTPPFYA